MTIPNLPGRSPAESEALDQALNAWIMGEYPDTANSLADEALEFHRWADEARRTDPAATGPAAGTWNRVLRSTAQTSSRGGDMSSAALSTEPQSVIVYDSRPYNRREPGHYLNLVATLAIVFAVTVGGWFAMSQLPPGDGDGRFAVLQGTPEVAQATCDVDPMTVDEVMEIVENPYKYAHPTAYGRPDSNPAPWYDDYAEIQPIVAEPLSPTYGTVPTESAMAQALPVLDQYLACMETGTVAQTLRFVDPFSIQGRVTSEFPFYRDEEHVRQYVSEWLTSGPWSNEWHDEEGGETLTFSPNRNINEARTQVVWFGLGFNQILYIGSNVMDENGTQLARYDAAFQVVEGESQQRWTMHRMVYSTYTGQWYVLTGDWYLGVPF